MAAETIHISKAINILRQIISSSAVLSTIISPFDPSSFFMASLCKAPYYTRNMNLTYSERLIYVFNSQNPNEIAPMGFINLQNMIRKKINHDQLLNRPSDIYNTNSSFLINFFPALISLLIVFALCINAWIIRSATRNKSSSMARVLGKVQEILKWNFFFAFSIYYYDSLVYYTSLELQTSHNSRIGSIMSIVVCAIINIGAFWMFGQTIRVVLSRKNQALKLHAKKVVEDANEKFQSYKVVYDSFRKGGFSQYGFYAIYSARIYLYFVVVSYMTNFPLAQSLIMLSLNLAALIYIVAKKPLKSKLKLVQYLGQEILLLVMFLLVFFTVALRESTSPINISEESIGNMMIAFYLIYLIFSFVMITVQIVVSGISVYRRLVNKRFMTSVHPEDQNDIEKSLESPALGGKPQDVENPLADEPVKFESTTPGLEALPQSLAHDKPSVSRTPKNKLSLKLKSRNIPPQAELKVESPSSPEELVPSSIVDFPVESSPVQTKLEFDLLEKGVSNKVVKRRLTLNRGKTKELKLASKQELKEEAV